MNKSTNVNGESPEYGTEEITAEQFWQMNVGDVYELAKAAGMEPSEFWEKYADMSVFPR